MSTARPGRVVYETYSVGSRDEDVIQIEAHRNRHEDPVHSRAHAEEIAAENGYKLSREGEVWDRLPEKG